MIASLAFALLAVLVILVLVVLAVILILILVAVLVSVLIIHCVFLPNLAGVAPLCYFVRFFRIYPSV